MQTTQFKLVDALQRIKENNFTIPNFQRKFKWTGSQVKLLIDSMARNYPIGSFLLLTKSLDLELASRNIEAIIRDGIPPDDLLGTVKVENNEVYYVLDGQQRLTSIARVLLNAHPERVYYFDLKQMLESFPRNETNWIALRKSSKNDQRKEKGRLIRSDVCLNVTTLEVFIAEYLESEDFPELKNDRQTLFKKAAEIKTIFERIRNYQLPAIILERDANIDSVCRVFETINTTGTKLDTFDLAVAKYYPEVDLHSLWQKTIKTHKVLREFDVNGERALQCLVLYRSGNLIRKYDEPTRGAILSLDKSYVDENWDYIVQNLASVYEWAKHQGARGDTLPNHSLLVTLAGAKACIPNFSEDNFITIKGEESVLIPPNSFALASSLEYFKMPRNVTGLVTAKSTYARCGLGTPPTVLEAGWHGNLVLEFSNHTSNSIKLYANSGAAQILFFSGDQPEVSYSDRKGKYQGQVGITLAKSK